MSHSKNGKTGASSQTPNGNGNGKKTSKRLPNKREKFVTEAIKAKAEGRSMTSAAIAAGYAPANANKEASRLLTNVDIQERIDRAKSRSGVTPEEIIGKLAEHMYSDVADLLDDRGRFDYELAVARGVTAQIKKLKIKDRKLFTPKGEFFGEETTYELETYNSQEACAKLANIFGLNKQAGVNPQDAARVRAEIDRLTLEGWSEEDARAIVLEAEPRAAEWLN